MIKGLESATPHKYQEICNYIIGQIERGKLRPGMRLPGVRVLGKEYGCNYHTVRHAFSTLARQGYVEMKQGSGTFVKERSGANGRTVPAPRFLTPSNYIGVLLPLSQRWGFYITSLIDQLHRTAEIKGLNLNIRTVLEIDAETLGLVDELREQGCCSIIIPWLAPEQEMGNLHDFVRNSSLPVVVPSPIYGLEENCYYRNLSDESALAHSTTHLQCSYFKALGYGNIALLGPSQPGIKYFEQKLLHYSRWMDRENMPNLLGLVDGSDADYERIISRWKQFKGDLAVIAYHDEMALEFISACRRLGVSIPGDIALLGHNNNPDGLRSEPTLSTMLCPYSHIARGMLEHARALADGASAQLSGREPKAFFIRESCGGRLRLGDKVESLAKEILHECTEDGSTVVSSAGEEKSVALNA
jgi:DNA-binding LacI/PurR family transcriptional regulator